MERKRKNLINLAKQIEACIKPMDCKNRELEWKMMVDRALLSREMKDSDCNDFLICMMADEIRQRPHTKGEELLLDMLDRDLIVIRPALP